MTWTGDVDVTPDPAATESELKAGAKRESKHSKGKGQDHIIVEYVHVKTWITGNKAALRPHDVQKDVYEAM